MGIKVFATRLLPDLGFKLRHINRPLTYALTMLSLLC